MHTERKLGGEVTKTQLKQIIKEELEAALEEEISTRNVGGEAANISFLLFSFGGEELALPWFLPRILQ